MIQVTCRRCKTRFRVPAEAEGKAVRCYHCAARNAAVPETVTPSRAAGPVGPFGRWAWRLSVAVATLACVTLGRGGTGAVVSSASRAGTALVCLSCGATRTANRGELEALALAVPATRAAESPAFERLGRYRCPSCGASTLYSAQEASGLRREATHGYLIPLPEAQESVGR